MNNSVEQKQNNLNDSKHETNSPQNGEPNLFSPENHSIMKDNHINELLEMIDKLEEHRKICQKTKNFIEAEEARNKIKDLKLEIIVKRRKELDIRHAEEINQVVDSQNLEIEKFNQFWNKKLEEYEEEAHSIEEQMNDKHKKDYSTMEEDLRNSLPIKPKTSPQHLNYKKVLENLARQGEYVEAQKIKVMCEVLEKEEIARAKDEREVKIKFILNQLITRQQSEFKVLKKRVEAGRSELMKARQLEFDKHHDNRLIHKFQNIRQEIELVQQLEVSRFEMAYRNYVPGEKAAIVQPVKQKPGGSRFTNLNNSLAQYNSSGASLATESQHRSNTNRRSNSGLGNRGGSQNKTPVPADKESGKRGMSMNKK